VVAGDLLTKMSSDQRSCLSNGPVFRSHYLKTEVVTSAALQHRAERFYNSMQIVTPPSPAILMPLYILLCQQMTLLVKSLDKARAGANPNIVFQVC
jgi:hypothetical protein